jgi:hypothetical protein
MAKGGLAIIGILILTIDNYSKALNMSAISFLVEDEK